MGAAIDALGDSVQMTTRNPILLLGTLLSGLILLFGLVVAVIPLVGRVIYQIVIVPLALAGVVAMANAAAGGRTSIGDFSDGINDHATSLMGAYGILFAIQIALVVVLTVLALVFGIGVMASLPTDGAAPGLDAFGATFLVVLLVALVAFLAISIVSQFLDVAVVVGGQDAGGSWSEALDLVTSAPLSVIGYTLLRGVVAFVAWGVPAGAGFWLLFRGVEAGPSILLPVGLLLIAVAFPVGGAVLFSYHVAYYRRRRGDPPADVAAASVAD